MLTKARAAILFAFSTPVTTSAILTACSSSLPLSLLLRRPVDQSTHHQSTKPGDDGLFVGVVIRVLVDRRLNRRSRKGRRRHPPPLRPPPRPWLVTHTNRLYGPGGQPCQQRLLDPLAVVELAPVLALVSLSALVATALAPGPRRLSTTAPGGDARVGRAGVAPVGDARVDRAGAAPHAPAAASAATVNAARVGQAEASPVGADMARGRGDVALGVGRGRPLARRRAHNEV